MVRLLLRDESWAQDRAVGCSEEESWQGCFASSQPQRCGHLGCTRASALSGTPRLHARWYPLQGLWICKRGVALEKVL